MAELERSSSYLWTKHFPDKLYSILSYLSQKSDEAQINEIKYYFKDKISTPVINDIIMDLSMREFIQKIKGKDRRKTYVSLTEKGKTLKQKLDELSKIM
jgi:DNA-binding MarR family transcriptional regulator